MKDTTVTGTSRGTVVVVDLTTEDLAFALWAFNGGVARADLAECVSDGDVEGTAERLRIEDLARRKGWMTKP